MGNLHTPDLECSVSYLLSLSEMSSYRYGREIIATAVSVIGNHDITMRVLLPSEVLCSQNKWMEDFIVASVQLGNYSGTSKCGLPEIRTPYYTGRS